MLENPGDRPNGPQSPAANPDPQGGAGQSPVRGLPRPETLEEFTPDGREIEARGVVGFRDGHSRARPFHMLRAQVLALCERNGWTSIGIVSAAPGAGKSFVAANLAAALARKPGLDVHLLDCDLRRPTVAATFGMPIEHGLEAYLSGTVPIERIGRRIEGTTLGLFPAMQSGEKSAQLLAQPAFDALLRATAADETRKIILCDLPPVFAGDDALIVLKSLDAYIHVVNSGQTGRRQFEDAQAMMKETPCAGTVLNQYEGGMFDPYGYGGYSDPYRNYYSSHDD